MKGCPSGMCGIHIPAQTEFYKQCKKEDISKEKAKDLYASVLFKTLQEDKSKSVDLLREEPGLIRFINSTFLEDIKFMKKILRLTNGGYILNILPKELITKEILLIASKHLYWSPKHLLGFIDENNDDIDFFIKLIHKEKSLLKYMPDKIKDIIELRALEKKYGPLEITKKGIYGTESIAYILIQDYINNFDRLSRELRDNKKIALFGLGQPNGHLVYKSISKRLQMDEEVSLLAVQQGVTIDELPEAHHNNIDILNEALKFSCINLRYIPKDILLEKISIDILRDTLNQVEFNVILDSNC